VDKGCSPVQESKVYRKSLKEGKGYDPAKSVAENDDWYYNNVWLKKGKINRFLTSAGILVENTVLKAGMKLFEGIGYVGSAVNPANWGAGFFTSVADNEFSKLWSAGQENMNNIAAFNMYKSIDYDDKGFFEKMGTANFWSQEFADGAAFMLSAFVPVGGAITKGGRYLGSLAKGTKLATLAAKASEVVGGLPGINQFAGKAGKVSEAIFGTSDIAAPIHHVYSVANEAFFETKGVIDDLREKRRAAKAGEINDPELANMSDEDFNKKLGVAGQSSFLANAALLTATNLFQNRALFKALGKGKESAYSGVLNAGFKPVTKEYSSLLGKLWNTNKYVNFGKNLGKGFLFEGYIEENAQLAIERINSQNESYKHYLDSDGALSKFAKQYFGQIGNLSNDPEASTSIGLGGLLGGGVAINSSLLQRKIYNGDEKIDYQGIFSKKKKDQVAWYKGFGYGELNNKKDLEDVPAEVLKDVEFKFVTHLDEVLEIALTKPLKVKAKSPKVLDEKDEDEKAPRTTVRTNQPQKVD
jgi:hypothetical protein